MEQCTCTSTPDPRNGAKSNLLS